MLGHEHDKRSSCWTLMGDDHNRKSGRRVWDECRIGSFPPIGYDLFPSLDRPTFGLPWQAERPAGRAWATLLATRVALGREEKYVAEVRRYHARRSTSPSPPRAWRWGERRVGCTLGVRGRRTGFLSHSCPVEPPRELRDSRIS